MLYPVTNNCFETTWCVKIHIVNAKKCDNSLSYLIPHHLSHIEACHHVTLGCEGSSSSRKRTNFQSFHAYINRETWLKLENVRQRLGRSLFESHFAAIPRMEFPSSGFCISLLKVRGHVGQWESTHGTGDDPGCHRNIKMTSLSRRSGRVEGLRCWGWPLICSHCHRPSCNIQSSPVFI